MFANALVILNSSQRGHPSWARPITVKNAFGGITMDHVVYVDARAKELQQLIEGVKTMIIRGATGKNYHMAE